MPDPEHIAAEYIRGLRNRRESYRKGHPELQAYFKRHDRKPPREFHNSSYLYIRSYDSDLGVRPFSGTDHWRSPDLSLSPVTGVGPYTTSLVAGETYVIRCSLRNRGDIAVSSAKVELFLTDPTLGFDTRFATNLTIGNVPSAWVGSSASAVAEFAYTVPPSESGHKCLFARTFSFAPLELPIDDFQLDPRFDRHVAQQNLNIVGQGQSFSFSWIHPPNARHRIELGTLTPGAMLALRHPVLADVKPALDYPRNGWGRLAMIRIKDRKSVGITLRESREGVSVKSMDRDGYGLDKQRELTTAAREVLRSTQAGETRMADHRDIFDKFRAMNVQIRRSTFTMTIPDLGLPRGQGVGLDIRSIDENLEPPEIVGGITLIIMGG